MNILILTVSAGSGHMTAAQAIYEEVTGRYGKDSAMIIDTLKYVNPILHKVVIGGYLGSLKANPNIMNKIMQISDESDSNLADISASINNLFSKKIKELIKKFKPDVIVSTHFFPAQMLSVMKEKKKFDIPLVTVVTDFSVHSMWKQDCCDAYVVADKYSSYKLISQGVQEKNIYPYGIPVREQFKKKVNKKNARELLEIGLDKLTFMLIGGGFGFGDLMPAFHSFIPFEEEIELLIMCGSNEKLRKSFDKAIKKEAKTSSIRTCGYVDNVSEFMAASDFIITKPGGLTISECMCMDLPMILLDPLTEPEKYNEVFLINAGIAIKMPSENEMYSFLQYLRERSLRIKQMRTMCRVMAKPCASGDIVDLCENLAD